MNVVSEQLCVICISADAILVKLAEAYLLASCAWFDKLYILQV